MQPLIQFKKTTLLFLVSLALAWFAAAPTATAQGIANVSTRSFVQTGDNVMIAGFILQDTRTVLIRALGPTLAQPPFNVPNVLSDPVLQLFAGSVFIGQNDDWHNQTAPWGPGQVTLIMSTGLQPQFNLESAIYTTLPAGHYTAIVRGFSNLQGNALVEVYRIF